jgi:transcriptional regulator with XRE-family HTH domain
MSKTRSRFATALQQARLGARVTQDQLVEMLHVNQRTAISWEAGERIPSIGIVFLLSMVIASGGATSTEIFSPELLIPYLLDDLERQKKYHQEEAFQELVAQGTQKLLHLAESRPRLTQTPKTLSLLPEQSAESLPLETEASSPPSSHPRVGQKEAETTDVEQLFTLIERLRDRPELLPVVNEFLDQMMLV